MGSFVVIMMCWLFRITLIKTQTDTVIWQNIMDQNACCGWSTSGTTKYSSNSNCPTSPGGACWRISQYAYYHESTQGFTNVYLEWSTRPHSWTDNRTYTCRVLYHVNITSNSDWIEFDEWDIFDVPVLNKISYLDNIVNSADNKAIVGIKIQNMEGSTGACWTKNVRLRGTPTDSPSSAPTQIPSVTQIQTTEFNKPTTSPTLLTEIPSKTPFNKPTISPSDIDRTTISPSDHPTISPIKMPSKTPSNNPTILPSDNPTIFPSKNPSKTPFNQPTISPSDNPTILPSDNPSKSPSNDPTKAPNMSGSPTSVPTNSPSQQPAYIPTSSPTENPVETVTTFEPTIFPTLYVILTNVATKRDDAGLKSSQDNNTEILVYSLIAAGVLIVLLIVIICFLIFKRHKTENKLTHDTLTSTTTTPVTPHIMHADRVKSISSIQLYDMNKSSSTAAHIDRNDNNGDILDEGDDHEGDVLDHETDEMYLKTNVSTMGYITPGDTTSVEMNRKESIERSDSNDDMYKKGNVTPRGQETLR